MSKPDRKSVSFTLREDLVGRLDAEADARVVGRNLLVEKALEGYLDALPPLDLPDVVPSRPTPDPLEA